MTILLTSEVMRQKDGGTAGVLLSLSEALLHLGHDVDVFFGSDCCPLIRNNNRLIRTLFGICLFKFVLRQRLSGRQYDVIDISGANAYLAGVMRMLGCAHVIAGRTHGAPDAEVRARRTSFKQRMSQCVYDLQCAVGHRAIDLLIVPTVSHVGKLPPHLSDIARAAPYGLDAHFTTVPIHRQPSAKSRVLYAGNWLDTKGVKHLVEAVLSLATARSDFHLTIVGADKPEMVMACFREAPSVVTVYPQVAQDELRRVYDANDIFVFPSMAEGYGRVVVEAMSREMCVITTNVGIVPDLIRDGVNGFIVKQSDSHSIAETLSALLDRPAIVSQIASAARRATEHLTWSETARTLVQIYSEFRYDAQVGCGRL